MAKKPGLGMMIIEQSRPMSAPPKYGETSEDNHEQESPAQEKEYHQGGGSVAPTPESVCYHGGAERCEACEYFGEGGNCAFLQMAVDPSGHCQRFESKGEDKAIASHDAGGMGMEMEGDE